MIELLAFLVVAAVFSVLLVGRRVRARQRRVARRQARGAVLEGGGSHLHRLD